jgi:hypothetical protein
MVRVAKNAEKDGVLIRVAANDVGRPLPRFHRGAIMCIYDDWRGVLEASGACFAYPYISQQIYGDEVSVAVR